MIIVERTTAKPHEYALLQGEKAKKKILLKQEENLLTLLLKKPVKTGDVLLAYDVESVATSASDFLALVRYVMEHKLFLFLEKEKLEISWQDKSVGFILGMLHHRFTLTEKKAAKKRGKPRVLEPFKAEIAALLQKDIDHAVIIEKYQVSRATLYKFILSDLPEFAKGKKRAKVWRILDENEETIRNIIKKGGLLKSIQDEFEVSQRILKIWLDEKQIAIRSRPNRKLECPESQKIIRKFISEGRGIGDMREELNVSFRKLREHLESEYPDWCQRQSKTYIMDVLAERKDEIVNRLKMGETKASLLEEFGCSPNTLNKFLASIQ